jgi:hypothetical protein
MIFVDLGNRLRRAPLTLTTSAMKVKIGIRAVHQHEASTKNFDRRKI